MREGLNTPGAVDGLLSEAEIDLQTWFGARE